MRTIDTPITLRHLLIIAAVLGLLSGVVLVYEDHVALQELAAQVQDLESRFTGLIEVRK